MQDFERIKMNKVSTTTKNYLTENYLAKLQHCTYEF